LINHIWRSWSRSSYCRPSPESFWNSFFCCGVVKISTQFSRNWSAEFSFKNEASEAQTNTYISKKLLYQNILIYISLFHTQAQTRTHTVLSNLFSHFLNLNWQLIRFKEHFCLEGVCKEFSFLFWQIFFEWD